MHNYTKLQHQHNYIPEQSPSSIWNKSLSVQQTVGADTITYLSKPTPGVRISTVSGLVLFAGVHRVALILYVPFIDCILAMSCSMNGDPLVTIETKVWVTSDWFWGSSKLNLIFIDVLACTGIIPETQTARPPLEGWIVGCMKPEMLGAWILPGIAPPGFDARNWADCPAAI